MHENKEALEVCRMFPATINKLAETFYFKKYSQLYINMELK